ncbi:hypothetical protein A5906_07330 [Bradyrhizobium sacchari]|nr:hypothetical protein A5906_07330 [Bradyrhizobium sacchari]
MAVIAFRPAVLDDDVTALGVPHLFEPPPKGIRVGLGFFWRAGAEKSEDGLPLLGTCDCGQAGRDGKRSDEIAPSHCFLRSYS